MKMFLVTAGRHLGEVWFRNDEDFRVGMNCIAIVAFTCRVKVLAFVLMSNHIHRAVSAVVVPFFGTTATVRASP